VGAFVLVFLLTLAAGRTGVVLKRECTIRSKIRQDIEEKRDGEFRLRHAAAAIADLPDGAQKDKLRVNYARTMLSRVPR
jgi:hypothetical protein